MKNVLVLPLGVPCRSASTTTTANGLGPPLPQSIPCRSARIRRANRGYKATAFEALSKRKLGFDGMRAPLYPSTALCRTERSTAMVTSAGATTNFYNDSAYHNSDRAVLALAPLACVEARGLTRMLSFNPARENPGSSWS